MTRETVRYIISCCAALVIATTASAQDFEPKYVGGYGRYSRKRSHRDQSGKFRAVRSEADVTQDRRPHPVCESTRSQIGIELPDRFQKAVQHQKNVENGPVFRCDGRPKKTARSHRLGARNYWRPPCPLSSSRPKQRFRVWGTLGYVSWNRFHLFGPISPDFLTAMRSRHPRKAPSA
jgi:hypothetical protein